MAGKRQTPQRQQVPRHRIAPRTEERIDALRHPPSATSVSEGSADDFEAVVAALQERFRRRTREQAARSEHAVRRAVQRAVERMRGHVEAHEAAQHEQLGHLREALTALQAERDEQVRAFRTAYREMRGIVRAMVHRMAEQDRHYDAVVASFLDATGPAASINLGSPEDT